MNANETDHMIEPIEPIDPIDPTDPTTESNTDIAVLNTEPDYKHIYNIFDRKNKEFNTEKILNMNDYFDILHMNNVFSLTREVENDKVLSVIIIVKVQFLDTMEEYSFSMEEFETYLTDLILHLKLKLTSMIQIELNEKSLEKESLDTTHVTKSKSIDQCQKNEISNICKENGKETDCLKCLHDKNLKSIHEQYKKKCIIQKRVKLLLNKSKFINNNINSVYNRKTINTTENYNKLTKSTNKICKF